LQADISLCGITTIVTYRRFDTTAKPTSNCKKNITLHAVNAD